MCFIICVQSGSILLAGSTPWNRSYVSDMPRAKSLIVCHSRNEIKSVMPSDDAQTPQEILPFDAQTSSYLNTPLADCAIHQLKWSKAG